MYDVKCQNIENIQHVPLCCWPQDGRTLTMCIILLIRSQFWI